MTQQALEQEPLRSVTLLIVEDDPDIQGALRDMFTLAGYQVQSTGSGMGVLDILEHEVIDLVVLDLMLPDISGYTLCEEIRRSTFAQVPIVMLTALTQTPQVVQGLAAGADDYIKKPFAPSELLLRVQNLLQRAQQVRSAEAEAAILRDTLRLMQRHLEAARDETQIEATLRREFLHNVTTHMQALVGIAEATVRKIPPGLEREQVQQLRSPIRGAALVYEISEALQSDPVAFGSVTRTIATALKSMYRPWKRVLLDVKGAPIDLPLHIATPLAMIVNELITNCFKHAFPDNRYGRVTVQYALEPHGLSLSVMDDGVGAPDDALARPAGAGRGHTTVEQLVGSLGGAVAWESGPGGTQARLQIPLPTTR